MDLLTLDWTALFLASVVSLVVLLICYFLGKGRPPLQDAKEMEVMEGWLPTSENINALPEPLREYIHNLATNFDPAGIVRENILIKDTCKLLVIELEEKKKKEKGK